MKQLLTAILIVLSFNGYGQTKKDTIPKKQLYDTVQVSSIYFIRMDSVSFTRLYNLISSIPPSMYQEISQVFKSINGSENNIQKIPQYALKAKKQK